MTVGVWLCRSHADKERLRRQRGLFLFLPPFPATLALQQQNPSVFLHVSVLSFAAGILASFSVANVSSTPPIAKQRRAPSRCAPMRHRDVGCKTGTVEPVPVSGAGTPITLPRPPAPPLSRPDRPMPGVVTHRPTSNLCLFWLQSLSTSYLPRRGLARQSIRSDATAVQDAYCMH